MQVVLEPIPTGWRASTGAPLDASAEAATDDEALESLLSELNRRVRAGARVVEISSHNFSTAPLDPLQRFAGDLKDDLLALEWAEEVRAYRAERERELASP